MRQDRSSAEVVYEGFVHRGSVGGASTHFAGIARSMYRELRQSGGALRVWSPLRPDHPAVLDEHNDPPVSHIRVRGNSVFDVIWYEACKTARFIGMWLRPSSRPDVILARLSIHSISVLVLPPRLPLVLEANGDLLRELEVRRVTRPARAVARLVVALQLARCSSLIAVAPGVADAYRRGLRGKSVVVIPNGTDPKRLPPVAADACRTAGTRFVYAGAISAWQDVPSAIRAFRSLALDAVFDVVGDGEFAQAARDAADGDPRIRFHGWRPRAEVMTLLSEASVIVVPFRADVVPGSPLKLYEAVGVGVPVVVPVGLDREVEKFDHVVAYDPARGVGGLAEALGQAVAQAPLGRVELERVRSEVSWDRRARDVLRHLGPFIGSDRKR